MSPTSPTSRVAYLSATCVMPDRTGLRPDHWEHDLQVGTLVPACAARGIELVPVAWDDPALDPRAFDAATIGTTWDYTLRPDAFLAALARIAEACPLHNPLETVRWNLDKGYLADLAERGAPVVPTLWRERADARTIEAAFAELDTDELVVKPRVGASAWRQARVRAGAPLPPEDDLPPADCLIQPFLPAAATEGELSFVYAGRRFSHALVKRPAPGDYRVQSLFGGTEVVHAPDAAELALAARVLDAVEGPLLTARVDMVRGADGALALMELELIEPYLYPEQGPELGPAWAGALAELLDAEGVSRP